MPADCEERDQDGRYTNKFQITSLIDAFETGSYKKGITDSIDLEEYAKEIDEFSSRLLLKVRSDILTSTNTDKCTASLLNLEYAVKSILKQLEVKKQLEKKLRNFCCSTCGFLCFYNGKNNFWGKLQNHEHFEENLAKVLQNEKVATVDEENVYPEDESLCNGRTTNELEEVIVNELIVEPTEVEFKFNFRLQYDPMIENLLYRPNIIREVSKIDQVSDFTVQCRPADKLNCLLCGCDLLASSLRTLKFHVAGAKHQRLSKNREALNILNMYHTNFVKLETNAQKHQIFFNPKSLVKCFCQLCTADVLYTSLEDHIFGDHKAVVLALPDKRESNNAALGLLDVYGIDDLDGSPGTSGSASESPKTVEKSNVAVNTFPKKENPKNNKDHEIVLSIQDPNANSCIGLLEFRFHAHLSVLEESNKVITCKPCNVKITEGLSKLKAHLLSDQHKIVTKISTRRTVYFCENCLYICKTETSWENHFNQAFHKQKFKSLLAARRANMKEYHCKTCNTVIFGDEVSVKEHINNRGRLRRPKEIKLPEEVKRMFQSERHVESEALKLKSEADCMIGMQDFVWKCCRSLELYLSSIYPDCKVYPFGSRITGLGNQQSDLDIFVDIGNMYTGSINQDALIQEKIVKKITKHLKRDKSNFFSNVFAIPTARTPIVQVFHKPTFLDCDLSFRHGLSIENTKFLKICLRLQPSAQALILLLKKWMRMCKLDEHVSTYALSMMVIFYMQVNGYLLSVKRLRQLNPSPAIVIDGWITIKYTTGDDELERNIKKVEKSFRAFLIDFFKYYTNFKFEAEVICPLMGHTIPKSSFYEGEMANKLPPEMENYVNKVRSLPNSEHFRIFSMMCIQDPFDLSHNLTKACQPSVVEKFKVLCNLSAEFLENCEKK